MDWCNERYVRLYTRDTADLLAIGWRGRFVWYELLRHADRLGVVSGGEDPDLLAEPIRIPAEIVKPGLAAIIKRGMTEYGPLGLVIRNFVDAQESVKSRKLRQSEYRERCRLKAKLRNETLRSRDDTLQKTTENDSVPCRTVPCLTVQGGVGGGEATPPSSAGEKKARKSRKPKRHAYQDSTRDLTREVISYLNTTRGSNFGIEDDCNLAKIARLEQDGYTTFEPFRLVIDYKWREWRGTKVEGRVCPKTLFGPQNFATYLDEAKGAPKEDDSRGYKFEFGDDEDVSPLLVTPPKGRPN